MKTGAHAPLPPEDPDRRRFFAHALRGAAAVSLVGVVGFASVGKGGRSCLKAPVCGHCPAFDGCDLPRAEAWRDQEKGSTR